MKKIIFLNTSQFLFLKFINSLILIFVIFFQKEYKPKISIFIPIYNKSKYLLKSIKSIQNQTLKDIEIIAINDYSSDNTLKILNDLSKNDSRIKIINNKKNYGLLYSRSMGIIHSKGEYIMNLDPDDEFEGSNNLKDLYQTAKKKNVDIVSFNFLSTDTHPINCTIYNQIIKQPDLFNSIYNNYNILKDYLFWNKIVKRKILLKSYKIFKKNNNYIKKWNYHEDNIWSILIHKFAKSKICINKLIYIYNSYNDSLIHKNSSFIEIENMFYRYEMIKKIFNKDKDKKYIIAEVRKLIFDLNYKQLLPLIKKNIVLKNKLINVLKICKQFDKCFNNNYYYYKTKNITNI